MDAVALALALLLAVALYPLNHAMHRAGFPETRGVASYYGKREAGKIMANGNRFDPEKMTCASRTFPFGTRLLVTYPTTGKSVVVTVTDRGPWVHGRVLDLSERAARELGLKHRGIGLVIIEPLESK